MNKIHLVSICKNESDIIADFIDYHTNIADTITVIDNGSTDGTLEFLQKQNHINLIIDNSDFNHKQTIIGNIIKASKCEIVLPLDIDERIIYDDDDEISSNKLKIKEYLQQLTTSHSIYKVKYIYNYFPGSIDDYSIERNKWSRKKYFINQKDFISTCPGFHTIYSVYGSILKTNISYIHLHYRNFERWLQSSRQKMIARLGDNWNNIEVLRNYSGFSEHTAKELMNYFNTGRWHNLKKDIKIHLS